MAASIPEWAIWKKIHQTATIITQSLQNIVPRASTPVANVHSILPLDLPYPHDILSPIASAKIPDEIRANITQCFTRRISELQGEYSNAYKKAYLAMTSWQIATFGPKELRQVYQTAYRRNCLPVIQSQVTALLNAIAKRQHLMTERKRPFNSEYIPLLETYFENNAYPSALDRQFLAQKTMMTPRQIEVWFQNHRNRAKKDGKILKRITDSPSRSILESIERKMPHIVVPVSERVPSITANNSDDDSEEEDIDVEQEFQSISFCIDRSATHQNAPAFDRDFIPQPFISPPVHWPRSAASTPIPARIVDMDEFIHAFSSLNIRQSTTKRRRNRRNNRRTPSPWFAATTTVPSCAPHPALVRGRTNSSYRPSTFLTIKPSAPCIDQYPWSTSFGPCRQAPLSSRKAPSLSRRTPATAPFDKYILSSPSSYTLSSIPRASSLSSVASSQSRSSSYSSISSQSEPKTPPLSPSQEIVFDQDDIATFEALESLFQGSPAMLDGLLSQNLAFDLPSDDFSKQTPTTVPVMPSYLAPPYSTSSHSAPCYSAQVPAYSDNLNSLLFIPDTNFLQVQF